MYEDDDFDPLDWAYLDEKYAKSKKDDEEINWSYDHLYSHYWS